MSAPFIPVIFTGTQQKMFRKFFNQPLSRFTLKNGLGFDIVLFDIQDVGVRFYTYISTLTYVMEAGAENGVEVIVLDRPNPHDGYIDGPVLRSIERVGFKQAMLGIKKDWGTVFRITSDILDDIQDVCSRW